MRFCLTLCAALCAAPSIADACGPPSCWPGYFTPGDSATVPANLPGIYWRPRRPNYGDLANDSTKVTLVAASAPATPIAFTAHPMSFNDYLLVPDTGLVEGETYIVTDHNACNGEEGTGPAATFSTGAAAPLPATLGTIATTAHAVETFPVGTSSGSCSSDGVGDHATVAISLDPSAAPWAAVLQYQTLVDGMPWVSSSSINDAPPPGASVAGRGLDYLYDVCSSRDSELLTAGLAPGAHDVQLRATLPGASVDLASSVEAVTLMTCTDPSAPVEDDGGCNASGRAVGPLALLGVLMFVRRRRS